MPFGYAGRGNDQAAFRKVIFKTVPFKKRSEIRALTVQAAPRIIFPEQQLALISMAGALIGPIFEIDR
jgi:hypothetical protein